MPVVGRASKKLFRKMESNLFEAIHIFGSIFANVFLLIVSKGESLAYHVKLHGLSEF